jgi:hypothetical protein
VYEAHDGERQVRKRAEYEEEMLVPGEISVMAPQGGAAPDERENV